jgi:hypothetical protein
MLVGIGSSGHAYSLDRRTAAATLLPTQGSGPVVVPSGNQFGLTEWGNGLILTSDTGQVVLINKGSWDSSTTTAWLPVGHWVAIAWYTAYAPPTSQNRQFMLDANTDMLLRNSGPNPLAQTITPIGPLGVDTSDSAGMDADHVFDVLYAVLTVGGTSGLYTLDQSTGHATLIGAVGVLEIHPPRPLISFTIDKQGTPILTQISTPPLPGSGNVWPESNVSIEFSVRRTGDDLVPATYAWNTKSLGTGVDFATEGTDYVPVSTVLIFQPGETEKRVFIQLLDDTEREGNEQFAVRLFENEVLALVVERFIIIRDDDNQPPVLTVTSPASLGITTTSDTVSFAGTTSDEDPAVVVSLKNTGIIQDASLTTANPWSFTNVHVDKGRNVFEIAATDVHGSRVSTLVEVWRLDPIDQTFVFAEGATGGFFSTNLLFANPNYVDTPITIDFLREDGVIVPKAVTLPATSRTTLDVGTIPGLEATATAAVVRTNNFPIVAERTMTWDQRGYGASGEKGASALSTTWLFAEGSQGFFKTFLLLVNPQTTSNDVTVRFLLEAGAPITKTYTMSPHQRLTVDGAAIPELQNQSFGIEVTFAQPGVAERSMYFGDSPLWTGGHESAGAPSAATDWFLAEGATGPFFETFLLLANPGSEPAEVTMTYLPSTGIPVTRTTQVPANGRLTVNIEFEDSSLANAAVATHVTSSKPIVVERSQYWPFTPDQWYEAHNSFGQIAPGLHWGLAEGRVGGPQGYQTYILLANPGTSAAIVTVRFLRDNGGPVVTKTYLVPPTSRFNLSVDSTTVPEITDATFGVDIISTFPIMVERSMYCNAIGQVWAAGTNATATRLP